MRGLCMAFGCCLVLALATGCISYKAQIGSPFAVREAISIQNGVTTRQEVVSRLGSPDAVGRFEGAQEKHFYIYDDVDALTISFIGTSTTVTQKARSLVILYDENDVVASHQYNTGHPLALAVPPFKSTE